VSTMEAGPWDSRCNVGPLKRPNVILVHGAWRTGSSWAKVIPTLRKKNLQVKAVQAFAYVVGGGLRL
jgi:hypothetical protein